MVYSKIHMTLFQTCYDKPLSGLICFNARQNLLKLQENYKGRTQL